MTETTFDRDGLIRVDNAVTEEILARLEEAVQRLESLASPLVQSDDFFVLEASGVGGWVAWQQGSEPFRGILRSVRDAHLLVPDLEAIAQSARLDEIVRDAVGAPAVSLLTSFMWAKPAFVGSSKPWHQDMAFAPPDFYERYENIATIWIAIDDALQTNGCLEFLPESHKLGLVAHNGTPERGGSEPRANIAAEPHVNTDQLSRAYQALRLPLARGSAVIFDGLVLHRSLPNTSDAQRRAVSYVYGRKRHTGELSS